MVPRCCAMALDNCCRSESVHLPLFIPSSVLLTNSKLVALGIEEVKDLQARFPVELASDKVFNTSSESEDRDYKMARGPTDGNNEHDPNKNPGLQGRWEFSAMH